MPLNSADSVFETELRTRLPEDVFPSETARYLEDPHGRYYGQSGLVVTPGTVDQVSTILQAANAARVGVVPFGGGTGLVGGQSALASPAPVIVSLERMNRIRAAYPSENLLVAEAGTILADIQLAAKEIDRLFPLSLAAEGSSRIGGNLATNAGGVNVLRYGNARDLCCGLEAVLPDGKIWNGLSRLRKDNTGYDLRNLLIGSEGTLGIITAATLKLSPLPRAEGTAFLVVASPQAAVDLLSMARSEIGEQVSAFELIHRQGLEFIEETLPEVRQPFDVKPEWCVLLEVGLSSRLNPVEVLETLFEAAYAAGLVQDGLVAQSQNQARDFWSVREHLPEANRRIGAIAIHDISIPVSLIPEFIEQGDRRIAEIGDFRINCFGHVGDGNLHYNVYPLAGKTWADHENERNLIKRAIYDLVQEMNGSISAEHGIGRLKVEELEYYGDPVKLGAMRSIKAALDPRGIMNPGAIFRS